VEKKISTSKTRAHKSVAVKKQLKTIANGKTPRAPEDIS